jgi:hypothetical protein
MANGTTVADEINDDVFAYEGSGGLTQCISNFGRNFKAAMGDALYDFHDLDGNERIEVRTSLEWHADELVRWCRNFNGKAQAQERTIAILEGQLAQAEEVAREVHGEREAPGIIRNAMALCEACAGLPEMSINRCPMCRELQTAL